MYVPKKMRINKRKSIVSISNTSLFGNMKYLKESVVNSSEENFPQYMNKVDALAFMDDYDREMQYRELQSAHQGGTEAESTGNSDTSSEASSGDEDS